MNTTHSSSDRLQETIYILGCGAIGFPLAAYLANIGRTVTAVRTSREDIPKSTVTVTVDDGANRISVPVETISLSKLTHLDGIIVIATKSHANEAIAQMEYAHSLVWSHGLHSLKTGEIAFDAAEGLSIWEYYAQHQTLS